MSGTRVTICRCCRRLAPHKAFGWCIACYQRWNRAGRPSSGPPPRAQDPIAAAEAGRRAAKAARMEDYQDLRSWDVRRDVAAARIGVSVRTVERYERDLRIAVGGRS
jgi:hypothetical protein